MTTPDLESIFHAARAIGDAAERRAYLDGACRGNATLRMRVDALLAAEARMDSDFLAPKTRSDVVDGETPGALVGRYKLLQQIGEGGFGVVWMAEQKEPVKRRVALKIIKLGMDTKQVVARFEQERQALALMDHPNIAKVFDAGATSTGRPYFVMELVKGMPIVEYCDQEKLDTHARLGLFVDVCRAIQHAHHKGIIHRDIKPSNVLVTLHDGRPVPKVIDFGIAKATSSELTTLTLFTEHRQMIGTPAYMSPEQAEMSGLDIDTRSDVYSLGVLLYELLTGTTPFDIRELLELGLAEMLRIIREVEPHKPSTRVSTSGDATSKAAERRRVDPRRFGATLRGELDWIVMRCLEKDRTRRYDTATSLALDVERFLAGEAISAAPPSAAYRARKWLRRNRAFATAGSLVLLALVGGLVATLWQARIAAEGRDAALVARESESNARKRADAAALAESAARALAESNAARADAVNAFLTDMLGAANVRELGRTATIAQALDVAAARVGNAFVGRPEVEAEVRRAVVRTYLSLGELEKAAPQLDVVLQLDRRVHGEQSKEYATSLGQRGFLQYMRGEHEAAVGSYAQAATLAEKAGGAPQLALMLRGESALPLMRLQRNDDAMSILRETLAASRDLLGNEHGDVLRLVNGLAVALHGAGRLNEAEALYREAYETGLRLHGADDPDTLIPQANLGMVLQTLGKFAEADALLRAARVRIEEVFGADHPKTGDTAKALGRLLFDQGRFKEALPELERAIEILSPLQGERALAVANAKETLAECLLRLGDTERSIAVRREANDVYAERLGVESRRALDSRLGLADALAMTTSGTEEAERLFDEVIEAATRTHGPDDELVGRALISLGVLRMRAGRFADAEAPVRRGTEISVKAEGANAINTLINEYNLSIILRELGKREEAAQLCASTLERGRSAFGPRHATLAVILAGQAETLRGLGRGAEAARHAEEALGIAKSALGERHATAGGYALESARDWLVAGDPARAEPHAAFALEVLEAQRGPSDRRTIGARTELGRCAALLGRFAEAEALLLESHERWVVARPAGHADICRVERYLTELYTEWAARAPDADHGARAAHWRATLAASEQAAQANTGK
ncbi:MAG: serine/threonine-protein kinase [Planctomycetes bacterium]|nr:serine/threonine-protein kinase [Planctomycetota bacterium]